MGSCAAVVLPRTERRRVRAVASSVTGAVQQHGVPVRIRRIVPLSHPVPPAEQLARDEPAPQRGSAALGTCLEVSRHSPPSPFRI
jgi:hypothetical protein